MQPPIADLLSQALTEHNSGRLDEAEALYRQILEREPLNADTVHLLGLIYYGRGNLDAAIAQINRAIVLKSNSAVFFNNLGQCYLSRLERPAAELCFHKAIELDQNYSDAVSNLAWMLIEQREYDRALPLLEHAVEIAPHHELALTNLGRLYSECHKFDQAASCFDRVLATRPGSGMALMGKLDCLFELHRADEALSLAEIIPGLAPSHASEALAKKGEILMGLGRIREAREVFDRGLTADPTNLELLFSRSQAMKADPGGAYIKELPRAAERIPHLDGRKRAQLCYALGKTYADLDDMESAARYYAIGAAAMSQLTVTDEPKAELYSSLIETRCDRAFLEDLQRSGHPSNQPIFILGMMRSGTTLTEQFLASHPAVFAAGELGFMTEILENFPLPNAIIGTTDRQVVTTQTPLFDRARLYLDRASGIAGLKDKARFTDKMPSNYLFLGLIWAMFPNAKIIHCRRGPIDTCISNYVTLLSTDAPWSYDFGALGRHYRRYHDLMKHWRRVLPGQFLELRYEQTVENPEGTARRLLDWCGLDWDDRVLEFHKTERVVRTASVGQVRQPIYRSSLGRWKKWKPYIRHLLDEIGDLEELYRQELAT